MSIFQYRIEYRLRPVFSDLVRNDWTTRRSVHFGSSSESVQRFRTQPDTLDTRHDVRLPAHPCSENFLRVSIRTVHVTRYSKECLMCPKSCTIYRNLDLRSSTSCTLYYSLRSRTVVSFLQLIFLFLFFIFAWIYGERIGVQNDSYILVLSYPLNLIAALSNVFSFTKFEHDSL